MTKKEQLAALKERYDRGRITKFQYGRMRMKIMAGESPSRVKTKDKKTESKARKKPSEVVKSRVSDLRSKVKEAAKEKAKEPKKTAKKSTPIQRTKSNVKTITAQEVPKLFKLTVTGMQRKPEYRDKPPAPKPFRNKPPEKVAKTKTTTKKRAAPKFNPSGLKVPAKKKAAPKKQKMYTAINIRTGKPDFNKPKVTAAERLKQEDRYKAYKRIEKAAKSSTNKKKRG